MAGTEIGAAEIRALVQPDRVHRRLYIDPAIFELEMDRIFGRAWLYVAHESQLKAPGDFVRSRLGRYEVLVTRHKDGTLHALHNRCAHRGARICASPSGKRTSFVCPYHGWSFRGDGSLEAVPHRESYPEGFSLEEPRNRLAQAPRVASYRGFVFASLAPDGPSLGEHLGTMTDAFDNLIERAPGGEIEIAESVFTLEYPGNWKMHMENANDVFHPSFVHESSVATARAAPRQGSALDDDQTREMLFANNFTRREWENVELVGSEAGHSYMSGFYKSGILAPTEEDAVRAEYRACLARRHGEVRAAEILGLDRFNNLIYPNISVNAQYHQLRVVHPLAADRTLVTSYCFRLAGAPDGIFHRAVRFLTNLGSPASMIFSDDVEMFARCQSGLTSGAADWIDVERGFGRDRDFGPGLRIATASELPTRVQFAAWLRFMVDERLAGAGVRQAAQ
ncbi:MAG TPA: Rieske 2Fe-2S domain-containing protein [Alphaproteobacteria bacterium]|nr:Rieske 2Fe-2S domain-containing protein [Alphaproteobacteria bacterium]